jgi:hypothetical protein
MENPKNNPKLPMGSGEKVEPKVIQRWSAARKREIVPLSTVIETASGDHPDNVAGWRSRHNAIQAVPDRPELTCVPLVGAS